MATDLERELFASRVLAAVGGAAPCLPPSPITGFMAMAGRSYNGDLMIVGRAVNGWTESIMPRDLTAPSTLMRYAQVVQKSVSGDEACPMLWVSDGWGAVDVYNTKRSAFWRVVRAVVDELNIADVQNPSWPSRLVWSNLYKVSPNKGGNPDKRLREVQLDGCIELLRLELRTYKPSRILFLTGIEWVHPFLDQMAGIVPAGPKFSHVSQFGTCTLKGGPKLRCVVSTHPQGKPGAAWVREVVEAFNR